MTLNASVSLVSAGKAVTLTGTVSPSAAPGYVTFFDGSTAIGVAELSSGTATLSTTTLTSGTHALSVGYGGSSAYYASNSAAVTITVVSPRRACTDATLLRNAWIMLLECRVW